MHASGPEEIARRFLAARRAGSGLPDYPGVPPETLEEAYIIQAAALARTTEQIAGWKVGRILPPKTERYGSNWLAGPIFAPTVAQAEGQATAFIFADGFGAVEAEFLFRIAVPPPSGKTSFSLEEAASLIDAVRIGIEVASSPFSGINLLGPAVTISDFGNNNGLLVGPEIADWRDGAYAHKDVITRIDGDVVGRGVAAAFVDGAIGSVRFLLQNLAERGIAVEQGWWISTGAVTGVHPVHVGQVVAADFGPYGVLHCQIEAQLPR